MGFTNMNQGTGNYTGIGPQTNFQAQSPMMTNPLQYNLNRIMNLIGDVVGYKFQTGELNQQAAMQCANWLRDMVNNGAVTNSLQQRLGNSAATDNMLRQFIDYLITEWVQSAAAAGMLIRGTPQQPVYNQYQQPMYGQQPMYSQYQQPMYNTYQQPTFNTYGQQPMFNRYQQPMYNTYQQPTFNPYGQQRAMMNGPSVDSIYGQANAARNSAMFNSAPVQNVGPNRVFSQQPQVSTYTAPQQPAQQPQQPTVYPNNDPRTLEAAKTRVANIQSQLNPVVSQPKVNDVSKEEADKMYPNDSWEQQIKYFKALRLMLIEYDKKIYGSGETKKVEPAVVSAQIVDVKGEPSVSDASVIKKVVAMNKCHNVNKPFTYKIGYKKQIVTDIAYSVGHKNHDTVMGVWDKFYELEDDSTLAIALETKPFEIAKALINKFKETSPAYQSAIEPIIVKMYNDVMDTASMFKDESGQYSRMEKAESIDDIYSACDLSDNRYGKIKAYTEYTKVIMDALHSSLFAMYIPYNAPGYLDFSNPKERAAALANPDIGVIVNYATDRYIEGATEKGKPVSEDKLKNLIDNELHKHFVVVVSSCVVYTNMNVPFVKPSNKVDFTPKKLDITNGDSSIFTLLTAPVTGEYSPARVVVPHVVLQQDKTTNTLPYVFTATVDGGQLARRIVA